MREQGETRGSSCSRETRAPGGQQLADLRGKGQGNPPGTGRGGRNVNIGVPGVLRGSGGTRAVLQGTFSCSSVTRGHGQGAACAGRGTRARERHGRGHGELPVSRRHPAGAPFHSPNFPPGHKAAGTGPGAPHRSEQRLLLPAPSPPPGAERHRGVTAPTPGGKDRKSVV